MNLLCVHALVRQLPESLHAQRGKQTSLERANRGDQNLNSPDAHHSILLITYLVNLEKNLIEVICCFSLSPVSSTDLRNKHRG